MKIKNQKASLVAPSRPIQFCASCGSNLVLKKKSLRRYSPLNGKPIYITRWGCSKVKWYQIWHSIW